MQKGNSSIFKFLILAGLGILLVSCQGQETPAARPSGNTGPEPEVTNEIPDNSPVSFALIALSDENTTVDNEQAIGCGDAVILVTREIPEDASNFEGQRIQLALEALFAVPNEWYGESGLYNALYQSDLTVDSIDLTTLSNPETINVALTGTMASGGTCDDPRIVAQIEETVKANTSTDATVTITINGKDLATYFDMSGQ